MNWRVILLALVAGSLFGHARCEDILVPASERYTPRDVAEVPDFRRHVLPLLGRLGCNGRACHGSFQGQGGFRLSLFGYDFTADYKALVRGKNPRVNADRPLASLLFVKPTMTVDHDGGQRFEVDSWECRLLYRWVISGAKATDDGTKLVRLELTPDEIVFASQGKTRSLSVVAHWSDGTREDVTPLCRFRTNDDSIAEIDASGRVTAAGAGDTHVVAFYDNGVAASAVLMRVVDESSPPFPELQGLSKIDEFVTTKLRKLGIVPAPISSDAQFLRRVSLDITGTLPLSEEVIALEADTRPDKRARKIDELLDRPTYSAWWAMYFSDLWSAESRAFNSYFRAQLTRQYYDWIRHHLAENTPYDRIIEDLIVAQSRESGQSYDQYVAGMTSHFLDKDHPAFRDVTERSSLPYYWMQRSVEKPEEIAVKFSHAFLGVRLQCAQCHKHPFDNWTQEDFHEFTAFFSRIRYGTPREDLDRYKQHVEATGLKGLPSKQALPLRAEMLARGEALPWREIYVAPAKALINKALAKKERGVEVPKYQLATPRVLGGDRYADLYESDPRRAILAWMREADNPYFVRAIVNRVWAQYFGVGIVDPPDDHSLANPPSNGPLLDYLAREFVAQNYDLRWLHREITNSRTYQSSAKTNKTNRHDRRNFSHALVRRLPAEIISDALQQATANSSEANAFARRLEDRAIADSRSSVPKRQRYVLTTFGQPARQRACDCDRTSQPSLTQALYLINDNELAGLIDRTSGLVEELAGGISSGNPSKALSRRRVAFQQAYLHILGRRPTEKEMAVADRYLTDSTTSTEGLRDVVWALLNTKEFITNH